VTLQPSFRTMLGVDSTPVHQVSCPCSFTITVSHRSAVPTLVYHVGVMLAVSVLSACSRRPFACFFVQRCTAAAPATATLVYFTTHTVLRASSSDGAHRSHDGIGAAAGVCWCRSRPFSSQCSVSLQDPYWYHILMMRVSLRAGDKSSGPVKRVRRGGEDNDDDVTGSPRHAFNTLTPSPVYTSTFCSCEQLCSVLTSSCVPRCCAVSRGRAAVAPSLGGWSTATTTGTYARTASRRASTGSSGGARGVTRPSGAALTRGHSCRWRPPPDSETHSGSHGDVRLW
jgi:hypothetical protein